MGELIRTVNIAQKSELIVREMEDMQVNLDELLAKCRKIKSTFLAELEETKIRLSEVKEARDIFDQTIIIDGVDPLTQRIPAEKFLRYMEEWLRSADSTIEKMRLRTATLKTQYQKVVNQLAMRQQLGETIHAVDFEKLKIENQTLAEKIEQKNYHLVELKKMNGIANLVLSTYKKYLQKQVQELNEVDSHIKNIEQKIIGLDADSEAAEREVIKAECENAKMRTLYENYKVPDIYEYCKKKSELNELKKNVKIWTRRNHIQKFALNTLTRDMKNLTGIKRPRPSWYKLREVNEFDYF